MNGKNGSSRRIMVALGGVALATALVLGLGINLSKAALAGPAGGPVSSATVQRVSAPLKPEWVEQLLDARATALRSLLQARDLVSSPHTADQELAPGSAPQKPEWVEQLLDARATALRALLEARDLRASH